ncbi:acyl-CoA dehydrogenase family protein [Streptomyces sp. NPDC054904]|uniref:acyl-CoA dehydrogenase family protein n=1 Tax=unclassified Streptomyces TaxID=2593676 RepID=UPI002481D511|nr:MULTISPECIES: acyl-CoA dehydrogenase family protein [unclassified Streptomyces]MDA5285608.1 acyl-CoA dehydrogenase family protein [Streptomyces sp. Isolate_45]MDX2394198.1 hydrolase [Streptomyces sp. DK15]
MPSPTSDSDLLFRAEELASVAVHYADRADSDRMLSRTVTDGIVDAGFARRFVPARWGGDAGSASGLLDALDVLAQGCTSTAWCASVIAGAGRMGAFLPEAGQEELWARGANTPVVGALMPRGSATAVNGGWRVTGEWDFTSAVGFSEWALVCALVPQDGERQAPWFFALPRQDYQVADTWASVGMRGTGSNTLLADNVFVPSHRGFARQDMIEGRSVGSDARCHTAPLRLLSGVLFGAPALGAARAALRLWAEGSGAGTAGEDRGLRLSLARSVIAVDGAALLLARAARIADAPRASELELVRSPADCAFAVEQLVDVVERLLRSAGSAAQLAGHPLQRIWRDVHSLSSHVALEFDPVGDAYGSRLVDPVDGLCSS